LSRFFRPPIRLISLVLIGSALVHAAIAQNAPIRPQVPVIIGGDAGFDACGSSGVVVGLDPSGDGFLAVKSGPGLSYSRIDKLYNGEQVYICGETDGWFAVVYTKIGRNCNVSTPWPIKLPYTGPCRSGWVFKRYVRGTAG
jgi:hypothetical protein